jgi:UDP-N-acetylglucosamine 4-epimerase
MSSYEHTKARLLSNPMRWVITGVAGFIGSHLLEDLLSLHQSVVGLDNFQTGNARNLDEVRALVGEAAWANFRLVEADIRDPESCATVCAGSDFVLHQAALGSVPRSMAQPAVTHAANVTGCLNMLVAARDAEVKRFVFASSSSVYGDSPELPRAEQTLGRPLSPYAAAKCMNEIYAELFSRVYGLSCIGLRYFNVFGPRQEPDGAYAAVIPKWTLALLRQEPVYINGDGETSRDFCFVKDVVQANVLAATTTNPDAMNRCYNIASGERITLNELFEVLRAGLQKANGGITFRDAIYHEFRPGDVRHSLADTTKARRGLVFKPQYSFKDGLELTLTWYRESVLTASIPKLPVSSLARDSVAGEITLGFNE